MEPITSPRVIPRLPSYNNVKHNNPILNEFEGSIVLGFTVVSNIVIWIMNTMFIDSEDFYKKYVFQEMACHFTYNILTPIIYISTNRKMRSYLIKFVNELTF